MVHFGICTGELWSFQLKEKSESRKINDARCCIIWPKLYSFYFGGFIVGAIVMTISLEFFGSKNTLTLLQSLSTIKWISTIFFDSITSSEISMFFVGFCSNIFTSFPIYIGEISPVEKRGTLIVFGATGLPVGILIYKIFKTVIDLKTSAIIHTCACSLAAVLFFKLKNTPYYFIAIGELKKAEDAISSYFPLDDLGEKFTEITTFVSKNTNEVMKGHKKLMLKLRSLTKPAARKTMFLFLVLFAWTRLSGSVTTFNRLVEKEAQKYDFVGRSAFLIGLCMIHLICYWFFLSSQNIDNIGRKAGYVCSSIGTTVSMLVLGTFYYLQDVGYDILYWKWIPAIFIQFGFISVYIGYYTVPLMVLSELPPSNFKSVCAFVASLSTVLSLTFTTECLFYLNIFKGSLSNACWFHAVISIFGVPIALLLLPETKMRNFVEIQTKIMETVSDTGLA